MAKLFGAVIATNPPPKMVFSEHPNYPTVGLLLTLLPMGGPVLHLIRTADSVPTGDRE